MKRQPKTLTKYLADNILIWQFANDSLITNVNDYPHKKPIKTWINSLVGETVNPTKYLAKLLLSSAFQYELEKNRKYTPKNYNYLKLNKVYEGEAN
jgi:hypothetical protein